MAESEDDDEGTVPYQFEIPVSLHKMVMERSQSTGVKVAPYMRMHFEKFGTLPMADILKELEQHNKRRK